MSLDHIEEHDRWEIHRISRRDRDARVVDGLAEASGTVVLWEGLDRILDYRIPSGQRARAGFARLAENLDLHLGMVFHRFLSGESRQARSLRILLNGVDVGAWDPFARAEAATRDLGTVEVPVRARRTLETIRVTPFILPPRWLFSSEHAFEQLAGPSRWNRQQGFYVYRGDRLIQSGGWNHFRTLDEHAKLARIAVEFGPNLDELFRVNIAKAKVSIPQELRQTLHAVVAEVTRQAQLSYRAGAKSGKPRRRAKYRTKLEEAASAVEERHALRKIIRHLRRVDPLVVRDLGW